MVFNPLDVWAAGERRHIFISSFHMYARCASCAGDCCAATCVPQSGFTCSSGDEHCVDPEHAAPSAWEDCDFGDGGWLTNVHLNDTWCHIELNTEFCGFDGGMDVSASTYSYM